MYIIYLHISHTSSPEIRTLARARTEECNPANNEHLGESFGSWATMKNDEKRADALEMSIGATGRTVLRLPLVERGTNRCK